MSDLYQVTVKFACAGIFVEEGVVVRTAPIFRWMTGKSFQDCLEFYRRKQQLIEVVKVG